MLKYTVKKGDTLSAIARKYNTTVSAIQKANASLIKEVNKIEIGWVIVIPEQYDYEAIGKQFVQCMKDIDNLSSIEKLFNMV